METAIELVSIKDDRKISLPALVSREGERASCRFLEFFTVHIRNANTRSAYVHAAGMFLDWCEAIGISELRLVQPVHVAGYIEQMQGRMSASTVKQHLACLRMLFDWLVIGQVIQPTLPTRSEARATPSARVRRPSSPPSRPAIYSTAWTQQPSSGCAIALSSP